MVFFRGRRTKDEDEDELSAWRVRLDEKQSGSQGYPARRLRGAVYSFDNVSTRMARDSLTPSSSIVALRYKVIYSRAGTATADER